VEEPLWGSWNSGRGIWADDPGASGPVAYSTHILPVLFPRLPRRSGGAREEVEVIRGDRRRTRLRKKRTKVTSPCLAARVSCTLLSCGRPPITESWTNNARPGQSNTDRS